jgi:hypothetical protein
MVTSEVSGVFADHTKTAKMEVIEMIKLKLTSVFGDMFKDAMGLGGGGGAEVPPTVLMGNSPEARRQRMIARLQKKQREKNL